MTRLLQKALAEASALPEADQDKIARDLLDHLERLSTLRPELQRGVDSIDRGEGRSLGARRGEEAAPASGVAESEPVAARRNLG